MEITKIITVAIVIITTTITIIKAHVVFNKYVKKIMKEIPAKFYYYSSYLTSYYGRYSLNNNKTFIHGIYKYR